MTEAQGEELLKIAQAVGMLAARLEVLGFAVLLALAVLIFLVAVRRP